MASNMITITVSGANGVSREITLPATTDLDKVLGRVEKMAAKQARRCGNANSRCKKAQESPAVATPDARVGEDARYPNLPAKLRQLAVKFDAQLQTLASEGLDRPVPRALRLLEKFGGDVEKVARTLRNTLSKRCNAPAVQVMEAADAVPQSVNADPLRTAKPLPPKLAAVIAQYASEVEEVQRRGYDMPMCTARLLNRFDGDVEKVCARLEHIKAKKETRSAKHAAKATEVDLKVVTEPEEKAAEVEEAADAVPQSVNADPLRTAKPLPPKLAAVVAQYASEVEEVQRRGYDMPVCTARLLNRFDGDVEKVCARLEHIKTKKETRSAKHAEKVAKREEKAVNHRAKAPDAGRLARVQHKEARRAARLAAKDARLQKKVHRAEERVCKRDRCQKKM